MKITVLLLLLVYSFVTFGACSSPISRTNNSPNTVLTSTKYNLDINTVYTKVNELDGDCITDLSIATAKLENGSVTRAKLAEGAVGRESVVAATSTYSITTSDGVLVATGSSFTSTLFTAVGNKGHIITLIHNGTSLTNVYTLDTTGGQTIGGQSSYALYYNQNSISVISDGTNWQIHKVRETTGIVGAAVQSSGANCNFTEATSSGLTNYVNLGTAGTCAAAWTVTGDVTVSAATTYVLTFTNMPPGKYIVTITGGFNCNAASTAYPRLTDGTTTIVNGWSAGSGVHGWSSLSGSITYATQATRTFKVSIADNAGITCGITNDTSGQQINWTITRTSP